jgi:hypothetical protein
LCLRGRIRTESCFVEGRIRTENSCVLEVG